jgi:hypothetical protein
MVQLTPIHEGKGPRHDRKPERCRDGQRLWSPSGLICAHFGQVFVSAKFRPSQGPS